MNTRTLATSLMLSVALFSQASFADTAVAESVKAPLKTNALISSVADKVIIPLYKDATKTADQLNIATLSFCAKPTAETLATVRQQWSLALSAWQTTEMALFGPALEKQRDLHIYFRPVKKRVIKLLWANEKPLTLDVVNFSGVGAKGFATLEYLLNDRTVSNEETLARFNTAKSTRHCAHLLAVSLLLKDDINAIYNAWTTDYPTTLANSEEAMSLVIGKLDQTAEAIANKLRQALAKDAHLAGKDNKREKRNAYKLEAWRSGHTLENIQANLSGVKLMLTEGGFMNWLNENDQSVLADKLSKQLANMDALSFPNKDLFKQVETGQLEAADKLFEGAIQLSRLIKEMAAAMDVQLGFNDNDGD